MDELQQAHDARDAARQRLAEIQIQPALDYRGGKYYSRVVLGDKAEWVEVNTDRYTEVWSMWADAFREAEAATEHYRELKRAAKAMTA